MIKLLLLLSICAVGMAGLAAERRLPTIEKSGRLYVTANGLATAQIAVKKLPGSGGIVACSQDRCAIIKDALIENREVFLPVEELAKALQAEVQLDAAAKTVRFAFNANQSPPATESPKVGQVAPNFRLVRLDGRPVSLADFHGKRVVLNSWASW